MESNTIELDENLFKAKCATSGGHTYMTSKARKQYIGLLCLGATSDVLRISVKFAGGERSQNIDIVWAATITVARFLESSPQGKLAMAAFGVVPGCKHRVCAGPLLPILTCLLLLHKHSLCICMESYGGKARLQPRPADPNNISDNDMAEIVNTLKNQKFGSTFLIERFASFLEKQANILPSCVDFRWGIGCTFNHVGQLANNDPSQEAAKV